MKKLVILSALALAMTGVAYAKPGGGGGMQGPAAGSNSSFGQSSAETAKAGNMDGKTQSADAHATFQKDGDDHGKHMAKGKGKDMGKHKGEMHDKKTGEDKK